LKLIGQFGSFFFIVTMGIHTLNTLVLRNRPPQWLGIVVTFIGWASALLVGLSTFTLAFCLRFKNTPTRPRSSVNLGRKWATVQQRWFHLWDFKIVSGFTHASIFHAGTDLLPW
jgi:hypothetical protein